MKKRVVITGIGIISNIGNDKATVTNSLKNGSSGIQFDSSFKEAGMLSHVSGKPVVGPELISSKIHRKYLRFMGDGSIYAALSTLSALEDANLTKEDIAHNPRIGNISGTGGIASELICLEHQTLREKGLKYTSPFSVPKVMNSSVSANIATMFELNGVGLSISAACSSSTHAVGIGCQMIQDDRQDIMLAIGADEINYTFAFPFDAMQALSRKYNDTPTQASRPYDTARDGFVISGGSATLILESLEHAMARKANIYAEIIGYGSSSDGKNMVQPSPDGAHYCMEKALENTDKSNINYINAHGTSTPVGDISELSALQKTFGKNIPKLSSTKSMTGHSLGACGAQEAVYSLLMMENNFIAPSINIEKLDPKAQGFPIVQKTINEPVDTAMSTNFGFGGNNAALVFQKLK